MSWGEKEKYFFLDMCDEIEKLEQELKEYKKVLATVRKIEKNRYYREILGWNPEEKACKQIIAKIQEGYEDIQIHSEYKKRLEANKTIFPELKKIVEGYEQEIEEEKKKTEKNEKEEIEEGEERE